MSQDNEEEITLKMAISLPKALYSKKKYQIKKSKKICMLKRYKEFKSLK